jgi:triacylglycerol lipase
MNSSLHTNTASTTADSSASSSCVHDVEPPHVSRRVVLMSATSSAALAACSEVTKILAPVPANLPPAIIFVHGNGDNAASWITTLWRFESHGWPRERLFALDVPYPLARDDDTQPQPGRSSTQENTQLLADEVEFVLRKTETTQVMLIASSRGGNTVRNYIANYGGSEKVSHAVLCGTPNHGVWADITRAPGSEFNGAGVFLQALNTPNAFTKEEVTPGPKWMTIRSDRNDKYAQPDGIWIGAPGTPTNVRFDGPALRGALNVILGGIDHRETAFSAKAFEAMFKFLIGKLATGATLLPENPVQINGKVTGYGVANKVGNMPSNLALAEATVEIYMVNDGTGERIGPVMHRKKIDSSGLWGPFTAESKTRYEFVITAPGYATTHIYRSPFYRSSSIVHLRAERMVEVDKRAASIITLSRPRGYFGLPRDQVSLDGQNPPPGIPTGTAGVSTTTIKLSNVPNRMIVGICNGERVVGRAWPTADNHAVIFELHY